jgi:hypothetical protein
MAHANAVTGLNTPEWRDAPATVSKSLNSALPPFGAPKTWENKFSASDNLESGHWEPANGRLRHDCDRSGLAAKSVNPKALSVVGLPANARGSQTWGR